MRIQKVVIIGAEMGKVKNSNEDSNGGLRTGFYSEIDLQLFQRLQTFIRERNEAVRIEEAKALKNGAIYKLCTEIRSKRVTRRSILEELLTEYLDNNKA